MTPISALEQPSFVGPKEESLGPWRAALRRLRRHRSTRWSLGFLVAVVSASLIAPLLPLPCPATIDLSKAGMAPVLPWKEPYNRDFEPEYWELSALDAALVKLRVAALDDWQTGPWLGTDTKGRDLLARLLWASRTSLWVALAAAACSLLIGVGYGATAGLVGGRVDTWMMRVVDVLYSIPFIFFVIFLLTMLSREDQPAPRDTVFFAVIGAIYWLTLARVVRGQVLSIKNTEFIQAARTAGASTFRILRVHVLPNTISVAIAYLTLTIPTILLFEAFLSFLGLGIQPPRVSWGLLALEGTEAINPISVPWWLIAFPALGMGATLLALNFLGDGLRDALDPRTAEMDLQRNPSA
jgi:oligopeptide transport system permease protein